MKKTKTIMTGVASALLCVALITGSAFAISAAVASPMETAPIVTETNTPDILASELNEVAVVATDAKADTDGTPVLVQSGNVTVSEDGTVTVSGQGAMTCKVGDDGVLRFEDYEGPIVSLEEDGTVNVSGQGTVTCKVGDDGVPVFDFGYKPTFIEGTPGEDDIAAETAIEAATRAIQSKYALTDETIVRFTSQALLNVANPNEPVWSVVFNPANSSDFSEIGCYNVTVNARTGEIGNIVSAADGKG